MYFSEEDIWLTASPHNKWFIPSVKTISGEKVPVLGKIDAPVKINGNVYQSQFHVMQNLAHEVLVGRDFLQQHGLVIDLKNSPLTLKDRPLKISTTSTQGNDRVFPSTTNRNSTPERGTASTDYKKNDLKISPGKEKYQMIHINVLSNGHLGFSY